MEDDEDDVAPVAALPAEVLQQVFSFLETKDLCVVGDVCRQWHRVSRWPSLWRHRRVDMSKSLTRERFLKIVQAAPALDTLVVRPYVDVPGFSDMEQSGATLCARVRELHVYQQQQPAGSTGLALALLRRYSPTAETLVVDALTADILHALAASRRLRALRVVEGPVCASATLTRLRAALRDCPAPIEVLEMGSLHQDAGRCSSNVVVMEFVKAKGGALRSLVLPTDGLAVITDDVLDEVVRRCPRLESLAADFCDGNHLAKSLPHLRHLQLVRSLRQPSREDIKGLQMAVRCARQAAEDGVEAAIPLARVERLSVAAGSLAENMEYTVVLVRLCPRLRSLDLHVEGTFHGEHDEALGRRKRLQDLLAAAGAARTRVEIQASIFPSEVDATTRAVAGLAIPDTAELRVNGGVVGRGDAAVNSSNCQRN